MEKTKTDAETETARDRDRHRDMAKTNTKHSLRGFVKMSLTLLTRNFRSLETCLCKKC